MPAPADPATLVDEAREAVIAAQEQAAAAHQRADALEKSLQGLRAELRQQREQTEALRGALERSQASGELAWWGLAGAAVLLLLALWVWLRTRGGAAVGRVAWWRARGEPSREGDLPSGPVEPVFSEQGAVMEGAAPAAVSGAAVPAGAADVTAKTMASAMANAMATPLATAPTAPTTAVSRLPDSGSPADDFPGLPDRPLHLDRIDEDPESLAERTRLMPPSTAQGSAPLQAVSMEELLELEQHVEFLVVLGQERAAVAQLTDHLRRTGGAYPLPYLKLMELHRRMADEQAYEAIRAQFNQRFNAVAPAFGAQEQASLGLEDYPATLSQIQRQWGRPVDAMALLENLLFRNLGEDFFDLAALGDVVFLYTLARDLERHRGAGTVTVDVLLMLEDDPAVDASEGAMGLPQPAQPGVAGAAPVPPPTPRPSAPTQTSPASSSVDWPALDLTALDEPGTGPSDGSSPPRIIKSGRL